MEKSFAKTYALIIENRILHKRDQIAQAFLQAYNGTQHMLQTQNESEEQDEEESNDDDDEEEESTSDDSTDDDEESDDDSDDGDWIFDKWDKPENTEDLPVRDIDNEEPRVAPPALSQTQQDTRGHQGLQQVTPIASGQPTVPVPQPVAMRSPPVTQPAPVVQGARAAAATAPPTRSRRRFHVLSDYFQNGDQIHSTFNGATGTYANGVITNNKTGTTHKSINSFLEGTGMKRGSVGNSWERVKYSRNNGPLTNCTDLLPKDEQ